MKQIVTCKEMKALDGNMIEGIGIPSCVLMERAALKVAEELERTLADKKQEERILCVCGSGNNGGDGVAVARILKLHGYRTSLYLVGNPDHRTVEMQRQLDIAAACQVPVVNNLETEEYTTIVDAIFGVGLSRPVEGSYRDVIMALNQLNAWKVAVDIPSGVNGDTGAELGIAFHADLTVTFAFRKAGLCLYPGRKFAGKVIVADVGIYASDKVKPYLWQTEKTDIHFLPDKIVDGNKGTFGKILVVAGSPGMCGAAYLSASGAFAVGIGMVKIVTAEENRIPLQTMLPEAMLDCGDDFAKDLDWCDIVVIGPGIGTTYQAAEKVQWFLEAASGAAKPVILDADGLNLLAQHPELTGCMFLPGDQPLLRRATVDQLLTAFAQTQKETERVIFRLGAPAGNGPDPLVGSPVLFSNGFFPELLTLPEGKGGSVLLHKYPTLVHTACIAQPEELADTDTPAALAQLEALVREKG